MDTLGSRIKHIRGRESQEAFAARVGISKGAIGGYERDENSPSAEAVLKICRSDNISVEWLMTGEGVMRPDSQEVMIKQDINATTQKPFCPNCLELYKRLDIINERLHVASERERVLLKENSALKDEIKALQACLSPSASDKDSLENTA
jgi:transcriptional regulator with XRE-family HTH domain